MAKIIQAAAGAGAIGGSVEFEAGGAVCEAGGWVCGRGHGEDVCGQGESGAGEDGVELRCWFQRHVRHESVRPSPYVIMHCATRLHMESGVGLENHQSHYIMVVRSIGTDRSILMHKCYGRLATLLRALMHAMPIPRNHPAMFRRRRGKKR